MDEFKKKGIITQLHYIPIYKQPFYKHITKVKNFINTESYFKKALSIPIFYDLKEKEQNHVIKVVKKIIG